MKYMIFNSDGVEKVTQETVGKANVLINTSEGKRVMMADLVKCVDGIRAHPDFFLDQLYLSIEAERKKELDWQSREGMRVCMRMLKVIEEMRNVMKRMIPEIELCDTEEEEKELNEILQNEK